MGLPGEAATTMEKPISFNEMDLKLTLRSLRFKRCDSGGESANDVLEEPLSFNNWVLFKNQDLNDFKLESSCIESASCDGETKLNPGTCLDDLASSGPKIELDAAALKLQKVYKSYRTRRNLADCAVVVEELWWKALDFASLKRSSISFFDGEKPESAVSRWARARTRAAKVGKGLSKNSKARKLALQHWLEAIDPRHRYGHNLHFYYNVWFKSESTQPFFYWLDIGDGKEVNLEKCPRYVLQDQSVKYLGPNERESYEVVVENGMLVYKRTDNLVNTADNSKWIFVLSTSRSMYVGQKKKGKFQHSSFLAGGATTAAGRLVVQDGILKAVWPYSGHYLPTEENFNEFISFLQENHVDLTDVKTYSVDDDDSPSFKKANKSRATEAMKVGADGFFATEWDDSPRACAKSVFEMDSGVMDRGILEESVDQSPLKWTTGAGPRIGCVRDYPSNLQFQALEQVNLPPMEDLPQAGNKGPIPSPRPGSGLRLSPMLANMAIPTPTTALTLPKTRKG